MAFYIPTKYVCPGCNHELYYSSSVAPHAMLHNNKPFCPECLSAFLAKHVPVMHNTGERHPDYAR